jgi:desulfoferrodoxin (superoxide reductase-like protein)
MIKPSHIQKITRRESFKRLAFLMASAGMMSTQQACEGVSAFENDPTSGYWKARVEQIEFDYPTIHTQAEPGNDINGDPLEGKINTHVPTLTPNGATLIFAVGNMDSQHVMKDDHFISVIYIKNQAGEVVFLKELNPRSFGAEAFNTISLPIPANATALTPYALCNLHELWEGETLKAQ